MLGIPAMEGVHRLPRVRRHHTAGIRKAPGVRVRHHDISEVHPHVEEVGLLAHELEPNHAIHVLQ